MAKQGDNAILDLLVGICAAAKARIVESGPLRWDVEYDKLDDGRMYLRINDREYVLNATEVVARFKEQKRLRDEAAPIPEEGTFRYVKGGQG